MPERTRSPGSRWHSAERCAEAQVLIHAAARGGIAGLERWARREASGTSLGWREYLAGAGASVLAVHALIAAAADARTTHRDAEAIDAVYLSIGALTMLDSLLDREEDIATGQLGYVQYYDDPELMARARGRRARRGAGRARCPTARTTSMTLAGVVAYYTSAPAASRRVARPVMARSAQSWRR